MSPGKSTVLALVVVTLAALAVSFGTSLKAKRVRRQMRELTQTKMVLEEHLRQQNEFCTQEINGLQGLKQALYEEQAKNKSLAEELQRQHAEPTESSDAKVAANQNFTSH